MPFLDKIPTSKVLQNRYTIVSHKVKIRDILCEEQFGFCAYSEKFIEPSTAEHLEHFDPRKKGTKYDDYWNWYATSPIMNKNKDQEIKNYEPLISPFDPSLNSRMVFKSGEYIPIDPNDEPVKNLISFLRLNRIEVQTEIKVHLDMLRYLREEGGLSNNEDFIKLLLNFKKMLSFSSAMTEAFCIDFYDIIINFDTYKQKYGIY